MLIVFLVQAYEFFLYFFFEVYLLLKAHQCASYHMLRGHSFFIQVFEDGWFLHEHIQIYAIVGYNVNDFILAHEYFIRLKVFW